VLTKLIAFLKTLPLFVKVAASAVVLALLIFLFVRHSIGAKADYWHGMYTAKAAQAEGLGYTIDSLTKEAAAARVETTKKIGELQGQIDSLNTVTSGQDGVIAGQDIEIGGLERALAAAKTDQEELVALRPLVVKMREEIALLKTALVDARKLGDLKDQKFAVLETAWVNLNVNYEKAVKGWAAEKEARLACGKALASLQIQVGGIKLERTIERALIVAGGAYVLLKK